jgi:hypothetical protein
VPLVGQSATPTTFRRGGHGPEPIFRSKRGDRLKILVWDGTGMVLTYKVLEQGNFAWPKVQDGTMRLSRAQFEALFEGLDYCQNTFYEAWRTAIQRYGIYNPWTKRGAIEGLLPHGPHNVRDVLATHILKRTGSYEQASYAIQDTPDMVAQHYGRFLPQDKSEIAARILNQVWEAA